MKIVIWGVVAIAYLFIATEKGSATLHDNACGKRDPMGPKIAGGQDSEIRAHPWMVMVRLAADGLGPSLTKAFEVEVDMKIIHDKFVYAGNTGYDIGLLRMARSVQYTDYVKPICLLVDEQEKPVQTFTVTGWGKNQFGIRSHILQEATLNNADLRRCSFKFWNSYVLFEICAESTKSDACGGDSGGPLKGSGRLFENNCGTIKDSSMGPKIENGRNANELSNPWMVAVFVGNVSMKVRLGEYNKKNLECECVGSICTPRAIDIDVDKKIMHRDYEGNINDIGLLRMKNEVTFTDKIRPICLLDKYPEEPIAHLKITGWGENGIGETQPILQEATVEIYERKWCKRKLSMDPLDVSRICAGDTGEFSSDSCKGDSDLENPSVLDNSSGKAIRCKWTDEEVEFFLGIVHQMKLQSPLRKARNEKVFKVVSRAMGKRNCPKTPKQLKIKFQQLRRQRSGGEPFEHFEAVHELLQGNGDSDLEAELESDSDGEADEDQSIQISETEGDDALDASSSSININARCKWTEGEVDLLLNLIHSLGLRTALLRKRNAKVKNGTGETFEHFEAMRQVLDPTEEEAAAAEAEAEANLSSASDSEEDSEEEEGDASHKSGAHFWTDDEVDSFLLIIRANGFFQALDGSRKRNFQTLAHISNILDKQGIKRTPHQLRNKLRLLYKRHREAKEHGLENVRILPRHFELYDDLVQAPRENKKSVTPRPIRHIKTALNKPASKQNLLLDSDSENSSSTCDLLRAAADSEDYEDALEMEVEPTPIEALSAIIEGQKQLLAQVRTANESFLRQQREQQQQFLLQVSDLMRRDREETLRRINEMLPPK
ncbi:hypothetical protein M5D96_008332 [Drosophila gunungcola]|uniref:Peptidase S1 domain-containing protein n=1 Tax=Drosophila gunungcola TaxID=103775 RepID=A0A9Q0BNY3_9MUSC|nr:hypothetical protein M5D96_008332 [Drosophila gunungcola]